MLTVPLLLSADELQLREKNGDSSVVTCGDLHPDKTWGPYPGSVQSEGDAEVGALLLTFWIFQFSSNIQLTSIRKFHRESLTNISVFIIDFTRIHKRPDTHFL